MSTRRLRYNSSMNGTDYDNMSMESLRARRAEIEAKRRQLEALDQQRMRDRTSLSSADYMTLKRTRAKIKKQSEIAFRRNQELTHAYDDLLQKHTHVIEDRTYLSRALARYKMHIGQNSDVWRSTVERYNQDRIHFLDSKRHTVEQRRQKRRVEFMREQQQAKKLTQKRTEYAIAEGQDLGEYMQMNEYRERLNAAMKATDEGVSEAAHRTAIDMRDRAKAAKHAHQPSYFTDGLLHKVAHDMSKHVAMAKEDLQQSDRPETTDLSTEDDSDNDDEELLELERKVLEDKKFLQEARLNMHKRVSPPRFDQSFTERIPERSRYKPEVQTRTPHTPSRVAVSTHARDTKPLSMTEIDKKQSVARQFPRKKPKARTPPKARKLPKTKTPTSDSTDGALSSISSPSASSVGESPFSSESNYDEVQKKHLLNVSTGMGEIRMVRAETDESRQLLSSIHSEGAAVGLQKHYRGYLARLQNADLASSIGQRAVRDVDEGSTYQTPQYNRSPQRLHERQQLSDSSESHRQQLHEAEENLHFQRLAAQHGYGIGMALELWDPSWSQPKECRVSKIIRDRLELVFVQEEETDISPVTKTYSLGEVDILTANFRQLESERKIFMTTLLTRNWTAGRAVSSVLLPHKGKRSPVQKQLISVNFMGQQKDLTLDQLEASVDAAGKRTELISRIRNTMHVTITEMMDNNSSSFDSQTIKKRVIERLQHPNPKIFRSKKWVKFFNEELKRCVKSKLDTHEREFKPSTPVTSTRISSAPVQKISLQLPVPPPGAPPLSVIKKQRDNVQKIEGLRNLEQQRHKKTELRNDNQDRFQRNIQEQQEDMSRIQTQKLEEHEQWRKEIKQTQVLIKKEQDKTLAEEMAVRERLHDEQDKFREQAERRLQEISERQEQELHEQELLRQRNVDALAHAMEQQEQDLENKGLALQQRSLAAAEPTTAESDATISTDAANSTDENQSDTSDIDKIIATATGVPPEPDKKKFSNNSAMEGAQMKRTKSMWGAFRNVFKKKSGSAEDKKKKQEKKLQKQDEKRKKEQTKQELKQQKKEQKELEKRRKKEAKELKKREKTEALKKAKKQKELEKMEKNTRNNKKQSQKEDFSSNHEREDAMPQPREESTVDQVESEREDESLSQRESSPSDHEEAEREDESQPQRKASQSDHEEAEREDESQPQRKNSSADSEQMVTDGDNRLSQRGHTSSDHEDGGEDEKQNQSSGESVDDYKQSQIKPKVNPIVPKSKPKVSSIYGDDSSEEEDMPESPLARSRAANVKAGPKPLVIPKTINTFGSKSLATPELGPSDVVAKPKVVNSFGSKSFVTAGLKSSATTVTKSLVTSKATSGLSADDNAAELPVDTANNIENETDIKAFDLESIGSDESALAIDDGAPIKRRQPTLATSLSSGRFETKKSPGDSSDDDEFGGFGKSTSLSGVRRGLSLGSTLHSSVSSFRSKNTSSRLPMQLQNLRSFGAGSDDDDDDF